MGPAGVARPYAEEQSLSSDAVAAREEAERRKELADHLESAEPMYALADLLQKEGKSKESLGFFTRAATYRRPTAEELRSVAFDYVQLGDYEDAIRWLEIAARMEPSNADVLYALGRCYYTKYRFQDAAVMYERVLAIRPKDLKAEENLGLVYDATNQPEKAEETLRNAAGWADPNGLDEWPYLDLGGFLLDHDRPKDAIGPLRIAVRIQPKCAACHEKLGQALADIHETSEALVELSQAASLAPKDPKTHYAFGRALRQAGQVARAQQEFELCQKLYGATSHE